MKLKFWLGALVLLSPFSQAASFDCSLDTLSVTEKAICSDDYLSGADNVLTRNWNKLYQTSLSRGLIKQQQLAWLKSRTACGSDVECIKKSYQQRIEALSLYREFQPVNKLFGDDKIDPPMGKGIVSSGGYTLGENPWQIKPFVHKYQLTQALNVKFDQLYGYSPIGHAVVNDTLFVYIAIDSEPTGVMLLEVSDNQPVRVVGRFGYEAQLDADPERKEGATRVTFYVTVPDGPQKKGTFTPGKTGLEEDSIDFEEVATPLSFHDFHRWQGYCADRPCTSYSLAPDGKRRVVSPGFAPTDKDDGVYLFEAHNPDSGVNVFSPQANERTESDFSYLRNISWGAGNTFYFDNEGGFACVWRTDIDAKRTERIIPVESVKNPYFLTYRGKEYVLAIDSDERGGIYIATP